MSDTESGVDHFDRLPDSLLLLLFNRIADVKSLARCSLVSRRFRSLVPLVHSLLLRVDCVLSDDSPISAAATNPSHPIDNKAKSLLSHLLRFFSRPFHSLSLFLSPTTTPTSPTAASCSASSSSSPDVSHYSPTEVLRGFHEIRRLRIELPGGELGMDQGVLLKWTADFGSTLDACVVLAAASVVAAASSPDSGAAAESAKDHEGDDNGSVPESFYTDGGLKMRVVWTISSLIAASARHFLLHQIISDHRTLESLELMDSDGQGVLRMNKEQLQELRVKPLLASASANRTMVPALHMMLWYAPLLELPDGLVLRGATLVAIRPSEESVVVKKEASDLCWVTSAFAEPYGSAVKLLLKRRAYCLEMNSF